MTTTQAPDPDSLIQSLADYVQTVKDDLEESGSSTEEEDQLLAECNTYFYGPPATE